MALYANPFALLYYVCTAFPHFFAFVQTHYMSTSPSLHKVVLYTDEAVSGNQMRPGSPRELQCYYYTLAFFPAWWRKRKHGWFPLGFMHTGLEAEVAGKLSGILKNVLLMLFSPTGFNLAVGIHIPGPSGLKLVIQMRCGPFIQDMKAHTKCTDTKSAGGIKCCIKCKTTCNTDPEKLAGNSKLHHYALIRPHQWDKHTPETYNEMADKLATAYTQVQSKLLTKEKFLDLQKWYGLVYNPDGILWNQHLRKYYSPATHTYEDWMHTLFSSGGVAQYECSSFVHALISLQKSGSFGPNPMQAVLDEFASKWRSEAARRLLPLNFFRDRLRADGEVLKCFAQECIYCVMVLDVFCSTFMDPTHVLPKHSQGMHALCTILKLLRMGDKILPHLGSLREAVQKHHDVFIDTYGVDLATPKLHYLSHVPDSIEEHGLNVDCRPMEHKHVYTKGAGVHAKKDKREMGEYVLRRMLLTFFRYLRDEEVVPNVLRGMIYDAPSELEMLLQQLLPDIGHAKVSREMLSHAGGLSSGMFLWLSAESGQPVIGKALFFAAARKLMSAGSQFPLFFVCFHICVSTGPNEWNLTDKLSIVNISAVRQPAIFCQVGDVIVTFPDF